MGVEGFKGYLYNNRFFKKAFVGKQPKNVSSLFVDCNGIFYAVASRVYKTTSDYSDREREALYKKNHSLLEEKFIKEIIKEFEKIIKKFNPSNNLILAVDGMVNNAKMNQQKHRRFKKIYEKKSRFQIFDTVVLTPGTDFMVKLDTAIEKWIKSKKDILPKKTIYSSHLSPGEGEHKIFDYIRKGEIILENNTFENNIDQLLDQDSNMIYGLDNDLIILSVVSPLNNMFMVPEDGTNPVSVDLLRLIIHDFMGYNGSENTTLIRDFSVVVTLLGNDFLPKFPNTGRINDLLPLIFRVYSEFVKKPLTDSRNNIIWENYYLFLRSYSKYENSKVPNYHYIQDYLKPLPNPYPEIRESIDEKPDGTISFDIKKFGKLWYKKQFNPGIRQYNGNVLETYKTEYVKDMSINYLKTVQWVQYYYTRGFKKVSNVFLYRYLYTPLMESLLVVLKNLISQEKTQILRNVLSGPEDINITPIHQLLSVFPYQYVNYIPGNFRELYEKELLDMNPLEFEISKDNTRKEHQKLALLPPVNLKKIDKILKNYNFQVPKYLMNKKDLTIE